MKSFKEIREKSLTNRDGKLVLTAGATPDKIALMSDGLPLIFLSEKNINAPKWQKFLVDYCGFDELVAEELKEPKHKIMFKKYPQEILDKLKIKVKICEYFLFNIRLINPNIPKEEIIKMKKHLRELQYIYIILNSKDTTTYVFRLYMYEKECGQSILSRELFNDIELFYKDKSIGKKYITPRNYIKYLIGDDD